MKIYIVDLESVQTRYTSQWKEGLPEYLRKHCASIGSDAEVVNISGGDVDMIATPGAFLNFAGTNVYKSNQAIEIAKLFSEQKVQAGDKFLFTDAWNPVIFMVRYMAELLGIPVELHGIWHAGSYDPQDFLGRLIKDKRWSLGMELSIFHALDKNHFATEFHIQMFKDHVLSLSKEFILKNERDSKLIRSGQPHNRLMDNLLPFANTPKRDLILFPHRVAPEKQPEIFRDLAAQMPEYEFVVCQDKQLTKDEYHKLLGESKIVFSANLQETLGISAMEAVLVNSIPMVPDRLSYSEMYRDAFKYQSHWTTDWDSYLQNRDQLVRRIRYVMTNYLEFAAELTTQWGILEADYLQAEVMFTHLTTPMVGSQS
jgi:hypothetical protein